MSGYTTIIATRLVLQLTIMKFALTLVIVAVLLPCMLAFNIDRQPEKDVLRKWLEEQIVRGQSSNDLSSMVFYASACKWDATSGLQTLPLCLAPLIISS